MKTCPERTAVLYSCIGLLDLDAHDDHLIPLEHWCRANGIRVVEEFTDDIPCDVRSGLEECIECIYEEGVEYLIIDSMNVLGDSQSKRFSAIRAIGETGVKVRVVDNGESVNLEKDDPFSRCLVHKAPDKNPPSKPDDDYVDVEPVIERTDDHITFTFLVPKGVSEFTIRIREVD